MTEKYVGNTKATHCKLGDSSSSVVNLCFWGAATAVMPLPLPVTPTAENGLIRDAGRNPIL